MSRFLQWKIFKLIILKVILTKFDVNVFIEIEKSSYKYKTKIVTSFEIHPNSNQIPQIQSTVKQKIID